MTAAQGNASTAANAPLRSIGDIGSESLSVRLYVEEIDFPLPTHQSSPPNCLPTSLAKVFGVRDYVAETVSAALSANVCLITKLYRVLGVDGVVNCDSKIFVVAALPPLCPDADVCPKLENVGYVQVPHDAKIAFFSMAWGDSAIEAISSPKQCGCGGTAVQDALLYSKKIGSYDDSFNPVAGTCHFHVRETWLHHEITLNIYGPDAGTAQRCLREAAVAAALAACAAACAGAAAAVVLAGAKATFVAAFLRCAGNSFNPDFVDDSSWQDNC
jgi:hypothetical protein